jgi:hypothetical protein
MASKYTLQCLYRINSKSGRARLADPLWQQLKDLEISKGVRGSRGGVHVQKPIRPWISNRTVVLNPTVTHGSVNVNNLALLCPVSEAYKYFVAIELLLVKLALQSAIMII